MNKKFLSAVLFGALMAGSSVTFTGCIDNDEPAGITELRGAKAALIRANEAYRLAEVEWKKTQVEWGQVKVEQERVALEIQKLNLQKEQAETDYEVAYYQAKKDSVIEAFKGELLKLQTTTAQNGIALEKALAELAAAKVYAKDSVFADKLTTITKKLGGASKKVETVMGEIVGLTSNLLKFSSDSINVAKEFIAADIKSGESKLANDSVNLAEFKKLAADYSNDAVNKQIDEIEAKIIAIDKKVAELNNSLSSVNSDRTPIEQEISKQKATLTAATQNVTFAVPSAIQDDFYRDFVENDELKDILGGTVISNGKKNQVTGEWSFTSDLIVKELPLGAFEINVSTGKDINVVDKTSLLSKKVTDLANAVQKTGIESYVTAYNNVQGAYNMGDLSNAAKSGVELTEADLAKGKAALGQVEKDLTTAKTTYEADLKAFEEAVKAYNTAAEAYGVGLQLNSNLYKNVEEAHDEYSPLYAAYQTAVANLTTFQTELENAQAALKVITDDKENHSAKELEDAQKDVEDAQKALDDEKAKIDTDKLDAARTALTTALAAYYPARKTMDGKVFKVTEAQATNLDVNGKKEFVIADKLASLKDEEFDKVATLGYEILYGKQWLETLIDMTTTENDGAAQAWVKATHKIYGEQGTNVPSLAGRKLGDVVSNTEKVARPLSDITPEPVITNVKPGNGSAVNYVTLTDAKEAFSNIDSWNTLATTIEGLATAAAEKEEPIVAEVAKQKAALDAINEPLRGTIYEICKLDADQFQPGKPVWDIAQNLGITTMNDKGEKQILKALKDNLDPTLSGELSIDYTYYTYNDQTGELASVDKTISTTGTTPSDGTIKKAIENVENSIEALKKYIADKNDDLAEFDNNSVEIAKKTKAEYEAALANAQERLEGYQAAFNALSKAKDELIAAMTAE